MKKFPWKKESLKKQVYQLQKRLTSLQTERWEKWISRIAFDFRWNNCAMERTLHKLRHF